MTSINDAPKPNPPPSYKRRKILSLALGGLFIGLFMGWLTIRLFSGGFGAGPADFNGAIMRSPEPINDFTLTAHTGERVRLADFRGKVLLIYYGYTYCPDVCPATMVELSKALEELKAEEREQVQVLMVTVDPDRDTPQVLGEYLTHFDPSFIGLSGSEEEIAAAAEPFGIFYQQREGTAETGYLVDHSATVAALDKDGYLRLLYSFNTPGKEIGADLRRLIRE